MDFTRFSAFTFVFTGESCGAPGPRVCEPAGGAQIIYKPLPVQWTRPKIDSAELARLRWINKWSVEALGVHFGRSPETIGMHFTEFRKKRWKGLGLTKPEVKAIENADDSRFWERGKNA